jgi:hypothetical protein
MKKTTKKIEKEEQCSTCKFVGYYDGFSNVFCRRYPKVIENVFCRRYPKVIEKIRTDWCGEWRGKK